LSLLIDTTLHLARAV